MIFSAPRHDDRFWLTQGMLALVGICVTAAGAIVGALRALIYRAAYREIQRL
jgi:hypothetical protein